MFALLFNGFLLSWIAVIFFFIGDAFYGLPSRITKLTEVPRRSKYACIFTQDCWVYRFRSFDTGQMAGF